MDKNVFLKAFVWTVLHLLWKGSREGMFFPHLPVFIVLIDTVGCIMLNVGIWYTFFFISFKFPVCFFVLEVFPSTASLLERKDPIVFSFTWAVSARGGRSISAFCILHKHVFSLRFVLPICERHCCYKSSDSSDWNVCGFVFVTRGEEESRCSLRSGRPSWSSGNASRSLVSLSDFNDSRERKERRFSGMSQTALALQNEKRTGERLCYLLSLRPLPLRPACRRQDMTYINTGVG